MSYIGKDPIVGNFQVCDAISVVNGQASYTMQVSSVNVTPESANHMLVSLNGILQKPNSSFTISGSTITFASNLATGDVIDFIMLLGNVLDIGVPSDSSVTDAKANFVSTSSGAGLQIKGDGTTDGTLQLNCSQNSHGVKLASPAHSAGQSYTLKFPTGNVTAGKVLKVDSISGSGTSATGQLTFGDAGGVNTPLFQASMNSGFILSSGTYTKAEFDVETYDPSGVYDHSTNYRFTPAEAGYYFIYSQIRANMHHDASLFSIAIRKNGTNVQFAYVQHDNYESVNVSAIDLANTTDYYEIYIYQNRGGNAEMMDGMNSRFLAFKLIS